ncbi:Heat shock transcription factor [Heracleum sosnowskyi]|uniref:Heat stress transcription factor n=1 Tax=Heracleum sosnowskyi TaxID=360622 RepID=A0AAD8MYW2_9APIA|nr:Heat shock transcription factor [Heracleum sosnowskyi]
MDQPGLVPMLEVTGSSSWYSGELCVAVPQAMKGLQGTSPPPFLAKICDLVDDRKTNHIVSWSKGNNSFVIWDPDIFATELLPKYFKHSNLSSFIRQLNTYGFRKVDPDKLEFASEWFLRGQRHLLKQIRRRKPPSHPQNSLQGPSHSCVDIGQFGSDAETDRLQLDTEVLRAELVRLRQEQQNTKAHLKAIEFRLKDAEIKQQHIMAFLTRMIRNPSLVQKLIESGRRGKLVEEINKKKSKAIDQVCGSVEARGIGQGKRQIYVELGSKDLSDIKISVMNTLSIEMQALEETSKRSDEGQEGRNNGLDKKFWEDLLNDRNEEESGHPCGIRQWLLKPCTATMFGRQFPPWTFEHLSTLAVLAGLVLYSRISISY